MKRYLPVIIFALSFLPLVWNGCSQGPLGLGNDGTTTLTIAGAGTALDSLALKQAAETILTENCSSCHMSTSGQGNVYNLTDATHLISTGLVVPGLPAQSPLYQEISTNSMPPGGGLSSDDKAIVRDWIVSLAPSAGASPAPTPTPSGSMMTPTPTPSATPAATPTPSNGSFADLKATILTPKCVGCHGGAAPSAQINLSTYAGVKTQVNLASPTTSKLYTSVKNGSMPKNGAALSSGDVAKILSWIQNGAPNN